MTHNTPGMDDESMMRTANTALRGAALAGQFPGLLGLMCAAARFAERCGFSRVTAHLLLDVAYRVSAEVQNDPTAPVFPVRRPKVRRARVRVAA